MPGRVFDLDELIDGQFRRGPGGWRLGQRHHGQQRDEGE
jgi:hypothetical protein